MWCRTVFHVQKPPLPVPLFAHPRLHQKTCEGRGGNHNNEFSRNSLLLKEQKPFLNSSHGYFKKKNPLPPGYFDNMTAVRCPGAFRAAIVPAISCPSPPGVNKKGLGVMEY